MSKRLGRRTVINRIRQVADELGRTPKIEELVSLSEVRYRDVANNFSSYSEALIIAGMMQTRKMVESARKKRGYIPPWNFIGGETKIPNDLLPAWKELSRELISSIGTCEPAILGDHPEGGCSGRLVANHIIPRRVGGPILDPGNIDVMCDRAHKVHKPDLYWLTEDDVDFSHLQHYQLLRLRVAGIIPYS